MLNDIKINRATVAPLLGEFLGTGLLALVALVLSETTAVSYFIGTSVALALGVAYLMFSGISGGHFNPAVTFGMWTARRVSTLRTVAYIVAQLLGGLGAWWLYNYFTHHHIQTKPVTYSFAVLLAEAVGALVLTMGFAAATNRMVGALESAWTYGTALFVAIIIASTASAGVLNPALALGMRYYNWLYYVGPLAGGLVGANLYLYLFPAKASKK